MNKKKLFGSAAIPLWLMMVFAFIMGLNTAHSSFADDIINITGISTDQAGNLFTGNSVQITVNAARSGGGNLSYQFYYRPKYGTAEYDTAPWNIAQNYSAQNKGQYSFTEEGSYIYVIRSVVDTENEPAALPIIGGVLTIGDGSHVNITGLSHNVTGSITPNSKVTFTALASNRDQDTVYYKFFYRSSYGTDQYESTEWTVVQDYSEKNTCDYTFPGTGSYIVVVRAVTDKDNEPAALPIIGCTVNVVSDTNVSGDSGYKIVDTGQKYCYGNTSTEINCPSEGETYFGQDALYAGNQPSYTDNSDGTVTDNVTGLMWEKAHKKVEWADAASDAASASTGGYSDWRVPTIKELYSLILFSGATGKGDLTSSTVPSDAVPYLDSSAFDFEYPSTGRFIDAQYITSTSYVSKVTVDYNRGEQDVFFGVNFADGRIKGYPKTGNMSDSTYYVRYVRGNTDYGINSFQDNGDSTVTDNATGLTWMKVDSGHSSVTANLSGYDRSDGSLNWSQALDFCENLTFAGRSDWRLPNAKELQSIVDYTRSPDTTGSAAIDPVFDVTAITVEEGSTDYPFYWTGTTHDDGVENAVYVTFGQAFGYIKDSTDQYVLSDVHGAGAQRSDPKSGNPADLQIGSGGPQGDVQRIYNYVRCVCEGATASNG